MPSTEHSTDATPKPGFFARVFGRLGPRQLREEELYSVRVGLFARTVGHPLLLASLAVVSFVIMGLLALQVIRDVRDLRQSTLDDIEWALNEAEVEFLSYQYELRRALHGTSNNYLTLRREFAIFQNRLDNLRYGAVYEPLREVEGFEDTLDAISLCMEKAVVPINASNQVLSIRLKELEQLAIKTAPFVRQMASIGQGNLGVMLDRQQLDLATTLKVLAATSSFLMVMLGTLAFYFNRQTRRSEARRRHLIDATERNRAVISSSLDAVIITDGDGTIQEFNQAAVDIFGYEASYAVGHRVEELLVPDALREAHMRGMARSKNGGELRIVNKGRVRIDGKRQNGETFPMEMALQRSIVNGRVMFFAFVRDISFRVRAERDLIEARDQALAGEKAKSRFLAVMSHEIRTPMNGMLGNMSLLRETPLTSEQDAYLSKMEVSGNLLMDHVNDVLDIARYEDGKPVVRYQPTNLRKVVEAALDNQGAAAELRGNHLSLTWTGPKRDWVQSDPGRLQQVLINLLSNAIKFTENGTIQIEVVVPHSGNMVELRVSDNGIGIAETDQERVFEDFVTHDDSFSRKTEGTGLGLGIARRIVNALSGEIGLDSELGSGSTFWIRLPMPLAKSPEDPNPSVPKAQPEDDAAQRPLYVLVVEDNEINRDVVRAMLKREGHEVVEAVDGKSGVELASTRAFDLILMDISMPVLDGRAATQQIRKGKGASSQSPIVALTAHVLPENVAEFMELGMQDVLPKPLMRPDLQRIIRTFALNGEAANSAERPSSADPAPRKRLINADTNTALRDSVGEAYDSLLASMSADLTDLSNWLQQEGLDLSEVASRCHKHASSAGLFGAEALHQLLIELELAGKAGQRNRVELRRDLLPDLLRDTLDQLSRGANAA